MIWLDLLAALVALAVPHEDRAAIQVKTALVSASASLIRTARHITTISPRVRSPCGRSPAWRMTTAPSSTLGESAGQRIPLLRGG